MSHAKRGFDIHSDSLTYLTDAVMTQRDEQIFGNESRKRKRYTEKKGSRPKLSSQERARFIREGKCFGCGETGHISAKCPKKAPKEQNDKDEDRSESSRAAEERGRKGKMKTGLVPDCVGTDPNTMDESTELCRAWGKVKDQEALIVFNGGAKANFISLELAAWLEITLDWMGPPAEAVLAAPGRDVAIIRVIGKLCLHCQGHVGHEDFYIMPLEFCDVLLGIPWSLYMQYQRRLVEQVDDSRVRFEIGTLSSMPGLEMCLVTVAGKPCEVKFAVPLLQVDCELGKVRHQEVIHLQVIFPVKIGQSWNLSAPQLKLFAPATVREVFDVEDVKLPTWPDEMCISEYLPSLKERIKRQVQEAYASVKLRKSFIENLCMPFGRPIEADSVYGRRVSVIASSGFFVFLA
ncbi:hypothetical protein L7F22_035322 [Adiantum nelumboides]|nr:hypothetical protein [Adiantum nelumboides]